MLIFGFCGDEPGPLRPRPGPDRELSVNKLTSDAAALQDKCCRRAAARDLLHVLINDTLHKFVWHIYACACWETQLQPSTCAAVPIFDTSAKVTRTEEIYKHTACYILQIQVTYLANELPFVVHLLVQVSEKRHHRSPSYRKGHRACSGFSSFQHWVHHIKS